MVSRSCSRYAYRRRHSKVELQHQFIRDAFLTPHGILSRHPPDQFAQLFGNWWPPGSRLHVAREGRLYQFGGAQRWKNESTPSLKASFLSPAIMCPAHQQCGNADRSGSIQQHLRRSRRFRSVAVSDESRIPMPEQSAILPPPQVLHRTSGIFGTRTMRIVGSHGFGGLFEIRKAIRIRPHE